MLQSFDLGEIISISHIYKYFFISLKYIVKRFDSHCLQLTVLKYIS